jgi:uncharacterized protein YdaU (DUF1376 family)
MADDRVDIFMPLFVRDFLASTIGWTAEEVGHYMRLLMLQWDRGSLPGELQALERLSPGVGGVWCLLEAKFPADDDGQRRNRRLEEHRERSVEFKRRRVESARRAAEARHSRHSDASRMRHACVSPASAVRQPCHPSPSPSPSPYEEEKTNTSCSSPPSDPPRRRKRSAAASAGRIVWDASGGWHGITDADREAWRVAYPAADLRVELAKAHEWLRANPAQARRSNWRRFVTGWLTRCQDRGGTHREPRGPVPPGPAPVPQERRRYYRGDADCSMTDNDYAAWRRDRQSGGTMSQVAGSLTVKEE